MSLRKKIEKRKEEGNLRKLVRPLSIDFASNDYLGFAHCQHIRDSVVESWKLCSKPYNGSTGSRLLTGNYMQLEELETQIAAFHGVEAALVCNSGYCANVGLLSCIANEEDVFLYDAHVHASSIDGMRLSSARKRFSFRHNDVDHLEKRLKMLQKRKEVFVVVESVYSCDGSLAPLKEMSGLCNDYGAKLIIDEAHATGVFGKYGSGLVTNIADQASIFARVHTFSKALGAFGAVILGSFELKEYLINFSRAFIYATALPLPVILMVKQAYAQLPLVESRRQRLKELVDYFKSSMQGHGFHLLPSNTQIQSLRIPDCFRVRKMSEIFADHRMDVRALCAPTVAFKQERLRFCLHSFNQKKQIDELIKILERI